MCFPVITQCNTIALVKQNFHKNEAQSLSFGVLKTPAIPFNPAYRIATIVRFAESRLIKLATSNIRGIFYTIEDICWTFYLGSKKVKVPSPLHHAFTAPNVGAKQSDK